MNKCGLKFVWPVKVARRAGVDAIGEVLRDFYMPTMRDYLNSPVPMRGLGSWVNGDPTYQRVTWVEDTDNIGGRDAE